MSRMRAIGDTLANLVTGLGLTSRDKGAQSYWIYTEISTQQLEASYRGDWIARKCVTIPADDATRSWRKWKAEEDQITLLEEVERKLNIRGRVRKALIKARLYGGAALVIGVDDGADPAMPLNMDAVAAGSLRFVHAVSRHEIQAGELERDLRSPMYGEPTYYNRTLPSGEQFRLHPTRVVRLIGNEVPDEWRVQEGWGDSILQSVNDALQNVGLTTSAVATMVHEAKFDVIKIPKLAEALSTTESTTRLTERFLYANQAKSVVNSIILDKEEDWERVNASFAGLPDILKLYLMIAAGAVDIPVTRMLGQAPQGMNSTGESDMRNYYDHVSSGQNNVLRPALERLDEVIIRSALGTRPPDLFYEWNSLWQLDDMQRADLAAKKAVTFKVDLDSGLFGEETLRQARVNQLIEDGTYPDFEIIETEDEDNDPFLARTPEQEAEAAEQEAKARGIGGKPPMKLLTKDYDPNQPRTGKGSPDGGQWTKAGEASIAAGPVTKGAERSKGEKRAIKMYQEESYDDWNSCLRRNSAALCKNKYAESEGEDGVAALGDLFKAVDNSRLSKDVVLYRGVTPSKNLNTELLQKKVGKVVEFDGFTSTSRDRRVTSNFVDEFDDKGTVFEIYAAKGLKALEMPSFEGEKEVLLPNKSKFYIESVLPSGNKKSSVVRLRYLGD